MIRLASELIGKLYKVEYGDGRESFIKINNASFLANSHDVIIYLNAVENPYLISLGEATKITNTDSSQIKEL